MIERRRQVNCAAAIAHIETQHVESGGEGFVRRPQHIARLGGTFQTVNDEQGRSLNFRSLVLDASATDEVLLRDEAGHMLHDGVILVTHKSSITGLIDDRADHDETQSNDAFELAAACRVHAGLSRQIALPSGSQLADDEYSLQALDHLVLASSRLAIR